MTTRRATRWIDNTLVPTIATGAAENTNLLGGENFADLEGMTLVRMLVTMNFAPAAAPAAFGQQLIVVSSGLVTGDAFAAAAVPDNSDDGDFPVNGWIFKTSGVVGFNPTEEEFGLTYQLHGDYRSMRRIGEDTAMLFQISNIALAGTAITIRAGGLVRLLVKLP